MSHGLSTGLLGCPHNMAAAGFPYSQGWEAEMGGATQEPWCLCRRIRRCLCLLPFVRGESLSPVPTQRKRNCAQFKTTSRKAVSSPQGFVQQVCSDVVGFWPEFSEGSVSRVGRRVVAGERQDRGCLFLPSVQLLQGWVGPSALQTCPKLLSFVPSFLVNSLVSCV